MQTTITNNGNVVRSTQHSVGKDNFMYFYTGKVTRLTINNFESSTKAQRVSKKSGAFSSDVRNKIADSGPIISQNKRATPKW